MNHRALFHQSILRLNPRRSRERSLVFMLGFALLGCAALAGLLWFVCNIVVVG
jgi:hypothetical protein